MDPVSRGEFWNILSGILEQGVTILMSTPYLDEAERCHRIGLMHKGRVFQTGTPDEVRASLPGQVYVVRCSSAAAGYTALRRQWPSTQLVLYGDHIHFWTLRGDEDARAVSGSLEKEGLGPVHIEKSQPSLEDVFVALLGSSQAPGGGS